MNTKQRQPKVLVIGAGMTGILAVIMLKKAGIEDVIVIEKTDRIGGTWRENTYPGVACDVPSHMYTYSFEPNPEWSSFFAGGDEIQKYFERVVKKYDVASHIRFNEAAVDAVYERGKWHVTSSKDKYVVDFLIGATGILHKPSFPTIDGLEDFKGNMFHTAQWDHSVLMDATQTVGIIGTGSTAAQAIPEMIKTGAKVNVFQRTAQWILPLGNFKYPKWLINSATRWATVRWILRMIPKFIMEHLFTKAVTGRPFQKWLLGFLCRTNLKLSIKDKALREKLRPNYQTGCKRVVINHTFYKGIQKPNANLITTSIDKIVSDGVMTTDGMTHKLDTLVLATGFDPMAFVRPMTMAGRNGINLEQAWSDKIKTYRSILLKDFPNFFLMLGPNTPIGNFSVIAMSEVQLGYIIKLIKRWQKNEFDTVEPQQKAIDDFSAYMKQGLKNTTWVAGCKSWYLDKDGDPILWPYTWHQWEKEMTEPDLKHLVLERLDNAVVEKVA
ncbi:MAG: NAD(P)/FAD-dependent oxidoreductase [Kangiellaceae bacterium]|jgi:cation diffusion facilitator CzcD-associated flavoprotein CzcO|nr:NAD(P)/FAD-dependent oxidoreductase [Kangiellaceae bacterium]